MTPEQMRRAFKFIPLSDPSYPGYPVVCRAAMAEERSGKDIEESFNHVLGDLAKDKLGKGAAEQLKDAADGSIKRQVRSGALGRAISRG